MYMLVFFLFRPLFYPLGRRKGGRKGIYGPALDIS
jgi:hypothetical protein